MAKESFFFVIEQRKNGQHYYRQKEIWRLYQDC